MTEISDPLVARLPAQACPVCGYVVDAVSDFVTPEGPQAGDLCVCTECAGVLTFTVDLTLRVLLDGEFLALPLANRREITRYRRFLQILHCAHVFPPDADACTACGVTRAGLVQLARGPGDAWTCG